MGSFGRLAGARKGVFCFRSTVDICGCGRRSTAHSTAAALVGLIGVPCCNDVSPNPPVVFEHLCLLPSPPPKGDPALLAVVAYTQCTLY